MAENRGIGIRNYTIIARIASRVYNPLNRLVRRNREMIANFAITFGAMMIPVGFLLASLGKISQDWLIFIAIIGSGALVWGVFEAKKEDNKREDDRKIFYALAAKKGVDVGKVLGRK